MWKRTIISGAAALFLALVGVQTAQAQCTNQGSCSANVTVNVPEVLAVSLSNADVTFTSSETESAILSGSAIEKSPSGSSILYRGNVPHEVTVGFGGGSGFSTDVDLAVKTATTSFVTVPTSGANQLDANGGAGSSGNQSLTWRLSGLDINTAPTTGAETATVTFTIVSNAP